MRMRLAAFKMAAEVKLLRQKEKSNGKKRERERGEEKSLISFSTKTIGFVTLCVFYVAVAVAGTKNNFTLGQIFHLFAYYLAKNDLMRKFSIRVICFCRNNRRTFASLSLLVQSLLVCARLHILIKQA